MFLIATAAVARIAAALALTPSPSTFSLASATEAQR